MSFGLAVLGPWVTACLVRLSTCSWVSPAYNRCLCLMVSCLDSWCGKLLTGIFFLGVVYRQAPRMFSHGATAFGRIAKCQKFVRWNPPNCNVKAQQGYTSRGGSRSLRRKIWSEKSLKKLSDEWKLLQHHSFTSTPESLYCQHVVWDLRVCHRIAHPLSKTFNQQVSKFNVVSP